MPKYEIQNTKSETPKGKMKIIIKGARVIDPRNSVDKVIDIQIENGVIARLGSGGEPGSETIDAQGLIACPGLCDMHVHLREPGREDEETVESGSRAAASGGFTAVACMPNTQPALDNQGMMDLIRSLETPYCRVHPVGAISKGLEGLELAEIGDMVKAGAVAVSDDGKPLTDSNLMRRALDYCRMFGIPVISHCEDRYLSADGFMNEGPLATRLGLRGIPNAAEASMAYRDCQLAALTGGRVHIAHVSCAETVEVIRQAKRQGIRVTAETCPHYLCLTEEAVVGYNEMARVNPPLKAKKDVEAVIEGLRDGTIDCIATDHAPHSLEEKEVEFDQAPCGMIGLETALGLCLTQLVGKKTLTLSQLVEKMSANPRRVLGLGGGSLEAGKPADLTLFDPEAEWTVDPERFRSLSRNTPFAGWKLKGRAVMTVVGGRVVKMD
jgi:dihydroorotase